MRDLSHVACFLFIYMVYFTISRVYYNMQLSLQICNIYVCIKHCVDRSALHQRSSSQLSQSIHIMMLMLIISQSSEFSTVDWVLSGSMRWTGL